MNGGGNAYEDFIGALMVNSVTMNGHFKFHYDEALSRIGGTGRFPHHVLERNPVAQSSNASNGTGFARDGRRVEGRSSIE